MEKKIKTLLTVLIAFTFAIGLSSCGSKGDGMVKEQIKLLNDYADAYEKNPKSEDLAKIEQKLADLGEKVLSSDFSDDDREKLANKYETEMKEASKRYIDAKKAAAFGGMGKMLEQLDATGLGK